MNLKNDCFSEEKDQTSSHPLTVIYSIHLKKRDGFSSIYNTLSDDISPNGDGNEHLDLAKIKT
jgi:hypothetical protein